jgi:hypothetical protein
MVRKILYLLLMLVPLPVAAQHMNANIGVTQPSRNLFTYASESAKGKPVLLQPLYWVKTLIDSSAVATVDRSYIEQPKPAWAIEARSSLNQATLKMETTWEDPVDGNMNLWAKSKNGLSTSAGLWLGYRGYGFGYSKEVGQTSGSTLSIGAMGGSFGINLRISSYNSDMPDIYIDGVKLTSYDEDDDRLEDPIKVRTLFLDGYYMLNGKHFSYAAAYDNSLIQKRSAGSIVVGGMYCHSRADYSADSNWLLTALMEGVGKVKFSQGSIGAGYAYNWVPARGWLVSAMAMPMLTFYNHTTKYVYDCELVNPNVEDWDTLSEDEILEWVFDPDTKIMTVDETAETSNNKVKLNFDARLSVVYNFDRWYLRVYGHYNRFRYGNDFVSGRVTDWTANASLGFRF